MAGGKYRLKEAEQQEKVIEKKFKPAAHDAAGSLQPHMLYARKEISQLVNEKLLGGVNPQKVSEAEPFKYTMIEGQVYVVLQTPIYQQEVKAIIDPVSEAVKKVRTEWKGSKGITRKELRRGEFPPEISMPESLDILWKEGAPPSESRAGRVAEGEIFQEPEEEIPGDIEIDDGAPKKKGKKRKKKTLFSRFPLLALTSKMGCMSFNMPAGPETKFGGTCIASTFGFPMLKDEQRPRQSSEWYPLPTTKKDGKQVIDYSQIPERDKLNWLCSGCYGLKGLYGSPLIFTMMECRRQWVQVMTRPEYVDKFIDMMTRSIRMSQAHCLTERFLLEEMGMTNLIWTIPDPAYFRIHDVGDVFSPQYLEAWFSVIRACAVEVKVKNIGLTLPAIKFWMPTRMWISKTKVADHFKCMGKEISCVPENLTLRPSAAKFGDAAPAISAAHGLSHGAAATGMSEAMTDKDMQAARAVVGKLVHEGGKGWICPAYLAPEILGGGGAAWTPMGGKRKGLQLSGGACARAYGPSGEEPAPKGSGCRACWDRPDLKIVYPEH